MLGIFYDNVSYAHTFVKFKAAYQQSPTSAANGGTTRACSIVQDGEAGSVSGTPAFKI